MANSGFFCVAFTIISYSITVLQFTFHDECSSQVKTIYFRHAISGLTRQRVILFRAWRVEASCNSGWRVMLFWVWRVDASCNSGRHSCFSGPEASTRHSFLGDASCFSGPDAWTRHAIPVDASFFSGRRVWLFRAWRVRSVWFFDRYSFDQISGRTASSLENKCLEAVQDRPFTL